MKPRMAFFSEGNFEFFKEFESWDHALAYGEGFELYSGSCAAIPVNPEDPEWESLVSEKYGTPYNSSETYLDMIRARI